MRRFLALVAFLLIPSSLLLAQDGTTTIDKMNSNAIPVIVKPSRDFLMLQFNYNNWLQKPDSVKTKPFGYGFNGYVCYDFPIKKSNLSFATGIGVSVSVVYLDLQQIATTDTTAAYASQARFIPYATNDSVSIKRYKFVSTYLTAPFELRYFSNMQNRNKGFKAAFGLKIGTLLGAHTKEAGTVDNTNVKFKVDTKRYVSPWDFAVTGRVGWGNFSLFMSYNLTTVFKNNEGPPITPASLGICLTGL